ncbi:hypothetical protein JCM8097_001903 [Rhodosporidiobolus ruineniae]
MSILSTAPALDAAIAAATADPYRNLPRVVFMAASSSTPVLYSGKGGYARLPNSRKEEDMKEKGEVIQEDSIFELYSCTKLVGTIAALQLVEQGKINLDADASVYLPELKAVKLFKGWEDPEEKTKPILVENNKPISCRQLITHSAGFVYYFNDLENIPALAKALDIQATPYGEKATPEDLYKMPLLHEPGSTWKYGTSIDWLTRIVEMVSGLDLESYLQKNIFGPLGITDISFEPNPAQMDMAFGDAADTSKPYRFAPNPPMHPQHRYGGAGLKGSAPSYLRLLRCILRGGELDGARILEQETVDSMFEPQLEGKPAQDLRDWVWKDSDPFSKRAGKSLPDSNWGLGGHLSGTGLASGRGARSLAWSGAAVIDRERDVCYTYFTNLLPWGADQVFDAWHELETQLYKGLP